MSQDYALLSIVPSCVNRGNLIIEYAARRVLGLKAPAVIIDAHQPLAREAAEAASRCRATVLPGATLLQLGDHPAVEHLDWITSPILGIGTSLRSLDGVADLRVASRVHTVVGSRDPFTHEALRQAKRPSQLVGCPTLLLGAADRWQTRPGPIVFSPGLGPQRSLLECLGACVEVGPTVVLLHAPDRQRVSFESAGARVEPLTSAEAAMDLLRSASIVVTSRMHAFLIAMIFGVPAIFLGGWYDSRYSLLEFLGVPIEPPIAHRTRKLIDAVGRGAFPPETCFERAQHLRERMAAWIDEVAGAVGLRRPPDLSVGGLGNGPSGRVDVV